MEPVNFRFDVKLSEKIDPMATFDIETVKLPALKGERWKWPSGETNSVRWLPVVFGFAFTMKKKLYVGICYDPDESRFIEMASELLEWGTKEYGSVSYKSRNKFDEMILRGRFINGRRSLAKIATKDWPVIEGKINLLNKVESVEKIYNRSDEKIYWPEIIRGSKIDKEGRNIIAKCFTDRLGAIMKHCARDVTENLGHKVKSLV